MVAADLSAAGLSRPRLRRLTDHMLGYVERRDVPGLIILINRRGHDAHCDILGAADDAGAELHLNSLFRLGSMTKPVATVGALTLMEEGRLRLSDRVDKYLPELSSLRVLRDPQGPVEDAYLCPRPITIEDLMTHRAGFVTVSVGIGPIGKAARVLTGGISKRPDMKSGEWLAALASLPLLHPPGERVIQGYGSDVLGIVIERIAGTSLDRFLEERVFAPLGMVDTHFWAPPEKLSRLVPAYGVRWPTGKRVMTDHAGDSYWSRPPGYCSAGGGLISTAPDYMRFGRMLLGGGALDGRQVLSRKTIELMTTNFMTPEQRKFPFFGFDYWKDRGFGLGLYVIDDPARHGGLTSRGQYGCRGVYGTFWFNDPKEDLTAVMMVQVNWPAVLPPILEEFETMVYQSVVD